MQQMHKKPTSWQRKHEEKAQRITSTFWSSLWICSSWACRRLSSRFSSPADFPLSCSPSPSLLSSPPAALSRRTRWLTLTPKSSGLRGEGERARGEGLDESEDEEGGKTKDWPRVRGLVWKEAQGGISIDGKMIDEVQLQFSSGLIGICCGTGLPSDWSENRDLHPVTDSRCPDPELEAPADQLDRFWMQRWCWGVQAWCETDYCCRKMWKMLTFVQEVDENMKREHHGRKSNGLLVHDSEAVHVQGRGCHPRGQAKGSECWAHIEQSPLKLQEGPENSFSVLPLHPVSSSSSKPQAGSVRQSQ